MRIIKTEDYDAMSRRAAAIIAAQISIKEDCVLGLATGGTPVGTYKRLVEMYKAGDLDFSKIKTVNLDEYVGLSPDNDQSYRYFMNTNLFDHVNVNKADTHVPDGTDPDEKKVCGGYDALIEELGGIDLQLLGLGPNGHIGFNEPDDHFPVGTHKVSLTESTIKANRRFFEKEEDVPRFAYTMGMGAIMQARRVLMVVSGKSKAGIVKEAFFGEVRPQVPASILRFHPDFTLVADADALSEM